MGEEVLLNFVQKNVLMQKFSGGGGGAEKQGSLRERLFIASYQVRQVQLWAPPPLISQKL